MTVFIWLFEFIKKKLHALKLLSAKRNKFLRKRVQTHSKILWYHETIVPIFSKWTSQPVVGLYVHLLSSAGQVCRTRYHGESPLSNWKLRKETSTSGLILSPKFCFTVQALELILWSQTIQGVHGASKDSVYMPNLLIWRVKKENELS